MSKSSISTNQELRKGEYLLSTNGNFKAEFKDDGNFVITTWVPRWSSNTGGSNADRIILEKNNNLVMYGPDNEAAWCSNTRSNESSDRMRLTITDEGFLVLDRDGVYLWSRPCTFPWPGIGPVIPPIHSNEKKKPT